MTAMPPSTKEKSKIITGITCKTTNSVTVTAIIGERHADHNGIPAGYIHPPRTRADVEYIANIEYKIICQIYRLRDEGNIHRRRRRHRGHIIIMVIIVILVLFVVDNFSVAFVATSSVSRVVSFVIVPH